MKQSLMLLVLVGLMIVSACGNANNGNNTSVNSQAENVEQEAAQNMENHTMEDMAEQPMEESVDAPAEVPAAESADEPAEAPIEPTAEQHAETPAAEQPAEQPASEAPAEEPNVTAAPKTYTVEIIDFAYSPASLEIEAGSIVEFINRDAVKHTATGDGEEFDTGLLGKDESKSITFAEAGEFGYYCAPHPGMKATIIVK